jgi:mono/diheme cytochrome c family protein
VKRWLVVLAACGAAPKPPAPVPLVATAPIDVQASAVVEQGDALYVLAGHVAMIVRGGIVAARAEFPRRWVAGASIPAPDGDGRWAIAVDEDGVPWHLTLSGERDAIADRFGLAGAKINAIAASGSTFAVDLGEAIAYSTDGKQLQRAVTGRTAALAVARGTLARVATGTKGIPDHLEVWDLAHGTRVMYAVAPKGVAFLDADSDHPRLVATTMDKLWVETNGQLVPQDMPTVPAALVARGTRAWLSSGLGQLFVLDGDRVLPARSEAHRAVVLAASTTGDAWVTTDRGLVRYSRTATDSAWDTQVAPVFQRVCSHCHLPGGEAGIDLSTAASWTADLAEIRHRVLETRTMPPAGTDLSDADRAALEHYLARH